MDFRLEWALITLTVFSFVLILYLIRRMRSFQELIQSHTSQFQQSLSQRMDSNIQTVSGHLGIITGQITNTANVMNQVQGRLGQMQEATKQVFELARQISSLQEVLQSPKIRGGLGEFLLADLLSQSLAGDAYRLQYRFRSGTIVDAAIVTGETLLCIDSKFPLENFRKMLHAAGTEQDSLRKSFFNDVKKHVNDIADKYILPAEKTLDFAMMFIPAENVYYEIIARDDGGLYQHCLKRRVIPVSPNTFYAYLQVILMGLRGLRISEQASRILAQMQQLEGDLDRFGSSFLKVGSHIRDAQNSFDRTELQFRKLRKKVDALGETEDAEDEKELMEPQPD